MGNGGQKEVPIDELKELWGRSKFVIGFGPDAAPLKDGVIPGPEGDLDSKDGEMIPKEDLCPDTKNLGVQTTTILYTNSPCNHYYIKRSGYWICVICGHKL